MCDIRCPSWGTTTFPLNTQTKRAWLFKANWDADNRQEQWRWWGYDGDDDDVGGWCNHMSGSQRAMIQWLVFGEKRTEGTASQPQSGQAFNSNFQIFQGFVLLKKNEVQAWTNSKYFRGSGDRRQAFEFSSWLDKPIKIDIQSLTVTIDHGQSSRKNSDVVFIENSYML